MTDEEKQAIEYMDKIVSDCENYWKQLGYTCNLYDGDEPIPVDMYKTVLNLIEKQQAEINAVQMEHDYDVKMIDEVKGEAVRLYKEIDKLKRQIQIKDKYLELMWFLGADYDGWDTVDGLKSLIDSLMDYAKKASKNDDTYAVYEGGNGKYFNILYEEVEKEEEYE